MPRLIKFLFICALAALPGTAAAKGMHPAGWRHCGATTFMHASGPVRVTQLKTSGVSCRHARSVLRNFYSQTIGSSGATYALDYGCNYTRVDAVCRKGSRRFRWHEADASPSASRRNCGTISVTLSPGDTRYARHITTRKVTCKRARRLARAVTADPGEGGVYQTFHCDSAGNSPAGGAIICRKGSTWVHWRY